MLVGKAESLHTAVCGSPISPEAYTRFKESIRSEVEKEAQALHSLYRVSVVKRLASAWVRG